MGIVSAEKSTPPKGLTSFLGSPYPMTNQQRYRVWYLHSCRGPLWTWSHLQNSWQGWLTVSSLRYPIQHQRSTAPGTQSCFPLFSSTGVNPKSMPSESSHTLISVFKSVIQGTQRVTLNAYWCEPCTLLGFKLFFFRGALIVRILSKWQEISSEKIYILSANLDNVQEISRKSHCKKHHDLVHVLPNSFLGFSHIWQWLQGNNEVPILRSRS